MFSKIFRGCKEAPTSSSEKLKKRNFQETSSGCTPNRNNCNAETSNGRRWSSDSFYWALTLELLEEKEAVLQKKISIEVDRAKEYTKSKNKQGVLDCMKRKKFYEGQMEQLKAFQSLIRNKEQRLLQKAPVQCKQGMTSKSKSSLGNGKILNWKLMVVSSLGEVWN